jgi:hypothetical protein
LLAVLLAAPVQGALAATPTWTQFGGPGEDSAEAVAVDTAGTTYVVGSTTSTLPGKVALGDRDAFVRAYDRFGHRIWTDQFGSAGFDEARGVAVDQDGNVYVAGLVSGPLPGQAARGGADAFIRKYAQGAGGAWWRVWTRQFGSPTTDRALGVAVDGSGNVYVTGATLGALPGQVAQPCTGLPPCTDAFLARFDQDGTLRWIHQFGTVGTDVAGTVTVDAVGDAYVVGQAGGTLPGQEAVGNRDAFVRKYDRQGVPVWTDQFGSDQDDSATGVVVDADGAVYVGGTLRPFAIFGGPAPGEGILRRYTQQDGRGVLAWSINLSINSSVAAVALDAAGGLSVAGSVRGALPGQAAGGGVDAFVRKYSQGAGEPQIAWTRQLGGPADDYGNGGAAWGRTGQIVVVGNTSGALPGLTSLGSIDAFAARLGPD